MGIKIKLTNSVQKKLNNLKSGKASKVVGSKNGVMQQSCFPYDLLQSDNYRSGIVCTAFNLTNRTRDSLYGTRADILSNTTKVYKDMKKNKVNQSALANIFLPPQKTVVDTHQLNYSEGKDGWLTTLQQKGWAGVVGSSVFGIVNEVTGGIMEEQYGESIDKRTKLMFNDADMRQMVYLNTFTFRNINDLVAFAEIYFLFTYLAYPSVDNSGGTMGSKIGELVDNLKKKVDDFTGVSGTGDKQFILNGLDAIKDFSVIKAPPVWRIQQFTKQQTTIGSGNMQINAGQILPQSTFGPAVITNIRFNKTPNSVFNQFRAFPNDPVQVEMEITFRELFPLRRDQLWDNVT